jgi:protein SCO1/2
VIRNTSHIILMLGVLLNVALDGMAQPVDAVTGVLKRAGITERIGESLDLETRFLDESGQEVTLSSYFDGEHPVVLTFVYHDCPMLCSLVLEGLTKSMKEIQWEVGDEYRALTISISPTDTPESAARQKARYASRLENADVNAGWHFLSGSEENIAAATKSAGFDFDLDATSGEYGHAATVILVSPVGMVTRYLYGIDYAPFDLRAGLIEASEGRVGGLADRLIMYCFQYDPAEGSYVPHAWLAMRLAGGLTFVLLAGMLIVFWRRERESPDEIARAERVKQEGSDE